MTQGQENSSAAIGEEIMGSMEEKPSTQLKNKKEKKEVSRSVNKKTRMPFDSALMIVVFVLFTLSNYIYHANMLASEAYSSPSIIMSSRR